ncbi:MAG: ABC transporter ATP-binding protein, partial [Oscillospiraceae bacterium]|nr:ABC transporter ATP-binding protein [Oscillospiraceae bacterium]
VFDAMQRLSMSFFNSKHTGSLMNRVNSDALDIQYFLNDGLPQFIINAITIIGIGTVVFVTNPLLAVLIMLPVPFIVYIIKKVIPKFKQFKWIGWHKSSKLNSVINDTLQGIRVVKAFGKEQNEVGRFENATQELYDVRVREGLMSAKIFPMLNYLMTIGGLFVWGLGGHQVLQGHMTFGTLMTFVGYIGMLYAPINFMIRTYDWWANCMNSAQRIFEIVDRQTDVPEAKDPVDIGRIKGEVELRDVTFAYEPNKPVLHNVSFHVQPGEMIGLVGHSGAGKSTITNIITRLYDVNEGELLIDGVNIKKIRQKDLHGQIGMVLQDTFLFNGTIAENIAYARPEASMEEIVRAAKLANAHDFIMKLPDGYETEIGKRKTNLSGGERQRISIARTVLLDPAILILDEATASLDTETEQQIQAALETLTKGRTTIAIAHRLSTLKNANRLVVVERGEIAEIGTHEELANKPDGIYARMVGRQKDALRIRGVGDEEQL